MQGSLLTIQEVERSSLHHHFPHHHYHYHYICPQVAFYISTTLLAISAVICLTAWSAFNPLICHFFNIIIIIIIALISCRQSLRQACKEEDGHWGLPGICRNEDDLLKQNTLISFYMFFLVSETIYSLFLNGNIFDSCVPNPAPGWRDFIQIAFSHIACDLLVTSLCIVQYLHAILSNTCTALVDDDNGDDSFTLHVTPK